MEALNSPAHVTKWEERFSNTVDGRKISALVRPGSGNFFVYIPGTWSDSESTIPLLSLLRSDLFIISVNMPGRMNSDPFPDNYSIEGLTADVLTLIDSMGIERFFISGHSLGAMTAIDFIRACSSRILGVIPIEGWTHCSVQKEAFGNEKPVHSSIKIEKWLKKDKDRRNNSWLGAWSEEQRQNFGTMWRRWDGYEILKGTSVPVLEIWGDRQKKLPSRDLMKVPPNPVIQIIWITGATHRVWIESSPEVANIINEFIIKCTQTCANIGEIE